MNDRDEIICRIKQLRERTTKRGFTEAEAMAAAEKAAGEAVPLHRGVGAADGPKLIGGH